MATFHACHSTFLILAKSVVLGVGLACVAHGQVFDTDLEVKVSGLPALMARSQDATDVLPTALDTIFHDRSVCCGRDSALEDSVAAANPQSLKDVASKLQGRHLLGDGRPIQVTAEFWPPDAINSGKTISALTEKQSLLMMWDSHLYVVYGAVYRWVWVGGTPEGGATAMTVIRKFLLLDTRFSDSRREVVFTRGVDDVEKLQGLLFLQVKPQ
jgi:hypothetical protein